MLGRNWEVFYEAKTHPTLPTQYYAAAFCLEEILDQND